MTAELPEGCGCVSGTNFIVMTIMILILLFIIVTVGPLIAVG